jgi:hypothetical protein
MRSLSNYPLPTGTGPRAPSVVSMRDGVDSRQAEAWAMVSRNLHGKAGFEFFDHTTSPINAQRVGPLLPSSYP